jgi:phosphate:Na+ symporter
MQMMSEGADPMRSFPAVDMLLRNCLTNPWAGLAAGAIITTIIQSSAATLAIVMTMAGDLVLSGGGTPGFSNFLPVVLGANIGTCSTAFLAMLQSGTEGYRVAWAHFAFKLIGAAIAMPFIWIIPGQTAAPGLQPALQIAVLHTAFNLYISSVFLPLLPLFDRAIRRLVPQREKSGARFHVQYLHDKVLQIPALALSQSIKEISRMSEIVLLMVRDSIGLINRYDFRSAGLIAERDDEVDFLHERIMTFLTKTAREELGAEEAARTYELIMVTTDIEHIGDIVSKRISELAEKIDTSPTPLSDEGRQEMLSFFEESLDLLRKTTSAFSASDTATAMEIFGMKKIFGEKLLSLVNRHVDRVCRGRDQSLRTSPIHSDLLEEIQRINHFTFRIAAHILKIHKAE